MGFQWEGNFVYAIDLIYTRILKACCFVLWSVDMFRVENHHHKFRLSLCPERHRITRIIFSLADGNSDVEKFQPLISFYLSERDSYFDDRHGMNKSRRIALSPRTRGDVSRRIAFASFFSPAGAKDSYFVVNLSKNALVRTNLSADCVGFT